MRLAAAAATLAAALLAAAPAAAQASLEACARGAIQAQFGTWQVARIYRWSTGEAGADAAEVTIAAGRGPGNYTSTIKPQSGPELRYAWAVAGDRLRVRVARQGVESDEAPQEILSCIGPENGRYVMTTRQLEPRGRTMWEVFTRTETGPERYVVVTTDRPQGVPDAPIWTMSMVAKPKA